MSLADLWRRMLARRPAAAELVAVAQAADLRTPAEVSTVLDTLPMAGVAPRYGDPAEDRVGTNRRPSHGAAWSVVKAGRDRWIDVATERALRDRDVANYPRIGQ